MERGDTLVESLHAQVNMLVDVSMKLVESDSTVTGVVGAQAGQLTQLIGQLGQQLRVREEKFDRAISKSGIEKDRLRTEISRLELLVPDHVLAPHAAAGLDAFAVTGASAMGQERPRSASSNVEELSDLRAKLRSQMADLEQLRSTISGGTPVRMVRAELSSSSDDPDPLTSLVFKRGRN
jgi:hypothetical protein